MKSVLRLCSLLFVCLAFSCQTQRPATEVKETGPKPSPLESIYALETPVEITEETVLLDARSLFEYTSGHLPGSVNIQWEDFSQRAKGHKGLLQQDLNALAARLALLGISPETPVIVLGQAGRPPVEAGRIAWMLSYLGVIQVTALPLNYFTEKLTTKATEPLENAPAWRAEPQDGLLVSREELAKSLKKVPAEVKVIDVRSSKEYLAPAGTGYPDLGAMNIPWTDFFSESGRPEVSLITRLQGVGVGQDQRIIVISEQGVRSAAVTHALQELGFKDAGNFAGGYKLLVEKPLP